MTAALSSFQRQGVRPVFRGTLSRNRFLLVVGLLLILSVGMFLLRGAGGPAVPDSVPFSVLLADVQAGRVAHVTIDDTAVRFERKDGTRLQTIAPGGYVASNP